MNEAKKKKNKFNTKSKKETRDVLDILLDENNDEPIVLSDENGKKFTFEQIAVIPYEKDGIDKIYAILKPIDKIEGIGDDVAIVFVVDERPEGAVLLVEPDEKIAVEIFERYYDLLEDAESTDDVRLDEINELRKNLKKRGRNLLDELLDEENDEPIELIGPNDEIVQFSKEYTFLYNYLGEEKYYALLRPLNKLADSFKKEYIFFSVEKNNAGEQYLKKVTNKTLEEELNKEIMRRYA